VDEYPVCDLKCPACECDVTVWPDNFISRGGGPSVPDAGYCPKCRRRLLFRRGDNIQFWTPDGYVDSGVPASAVKVRPVTEAEIDGAD
jgi:hypothetical protein